MKRSSRIDLARMRKTCGPSLRISARLTLVGAGTLALSGCSSDEAYIYQTVSECALDNPEALFQCQAAYEQAQAEWTQTAPRYRNRSDCEYEFGDSSCDVHQGLFIPLMMGFMLAQAGGDSDFDVDFRRPKPLTTSRNKRSPVYEKWTGARGWVYGDYYQNKVSVDKSVFKPLKGKAKVLGRGGFGKIAAGRSRGG